MAASHIPLSLLSKGVGQISKNGHEKLDVRYEPEDYYNWESKNQRYQLAKYRRQTLQGNHHINGKDHFLPLHKTFLTRKGALLLFAEELANRVNDDEEEVEERQRLKIAKKSNNVVPWKSSMGLQSYEEETKMEEPEEVELKTCHDLSWAILNYGNQRPVYRQKGDDLYLRFRYEPKAAFAERHIRPGFSPKRYISTWSKQWNNAMLQKLRTNGLISDKTLYRQNPLLPHLYKNASYNLSSIPPPYRVTKRMLLAPGNVPSYEFYRVRAPQPPASDDSMELKSRVPPPSQDEPLAFPINSIQAVKYHETGEIMEVAYAELKPREKQEILAELLIAAHEHQQHIRETLDLVMSKSKKMTESEPGGSSSAASELMVDMQRAIMSLVESPVRQQMRERQKLLREREEQLEEQKKLKQLKEERKQQRRQKRLEQKAKEAAAAERIKMEHMKDAVKVEPPPKEEKLPQAAKHDAKHEIDSREEEKRQKEERKRKRREEREMRRKQREDKVREEERRMAEEAAAAATAKTIQDKQAERPPFRDEARHTPDSKEEAKRHHRHHRKHHHHRGDAEDVEGAAGDDDRKKRRHKKRSQRDQPLEVNQQGETKLLLPSQPQVMSAKEAVASGVPVLNETSISVYDDASQPRDAYVVLDKPPPGSVLEIQHEHKKFGRKFVRQDATLVGPTQVPTNTPAIDTRYMASVREKTDKEIEYQDVYVMKRIGGSHHSSLDDANVALAAAGGSYLLRQTTEDLPPSEHEAPRGPRSVVSSHSSGPKQVLFAPDLPGDDSLSQKRSAGFYSGAMPITSNIVKQTLSDKVSLLSASQNASESASKHSSSRKSPPASYQSSKANQSGPSMRQSDREGSAEKRQLTMLVPSIGIEPATPMQANLQASVTPNEGMIPRTQLLAPSGSLPGSHHSLTKTSDSKSVGSGDDDFSEEQGSSEHDGGKIPPKRGSDNEESDNSDDDLSKSSQSTEKKSSKREFASKSSQTVSSKSSKSKRALKRSKESSLRSDKFDLTSEAEAPVYGLKGATGPGSQSSSSFLKSSSTKKSVRTRGSLPSSLKKGKNLAAVKMPDGEVVPVGGTIGRSSDKEISETEDEDMLSESTKATSEWKGAQQVPSEQPKSVLKANEQRSVLSRDSSVASVKQDRRVSFMEPNIKDEDEKVATSEEEPEEEEESSEGEESEENDTGWPEVTEEVVSLKGSSGPASRPISSRSETLTAHAQKVAAIVVKKQRPKSGLSEDAEDAAAMWNEAFSADEQGETEEESEASEETQTEASTEKPKEISRAKPGTTADKEESKKPDRLKNISTEKKQEKVIRPTVTLPVTKAASKPSSVKSSSSAPSSVSSVQEDFVNKIQEKAADLGIEPSDLEFEADVVDKLERSDIQPDDVEVVHDKDVGRHVVRSRRSSTTVSSALTPSSGETHDTARETAKQAAVTVKPKEKVLQAEESRVPRPKQKLVVDLNPAMPSASRASSVTTSEASTSRSHVHSAMSRGSSMSPERRRPSIPVDQSKVQLDYDVTTYESKLGDPKQEDPVIQSPRRPIEPEKIKKQKDKAKAPESQAPAKSKAVTSLKQPDAAESVKSDQSSGKPSSKSRAQAKTKQPAAPTKGPLRKGKAGTKQDSDQILAQEREESFSSEQASDDTEKLSEKKSSKTQARSKKSDKARKGKMEAIATVAESESPPAKTPLKTPETPFRAGRPIEKKTPEEPVPLQSSSEENAESVASFAKSKKSDKGKKKKAQQAPVSQAPVKKDEKPMEKAPAKEKGASRAPARKESPVKSEQIEKEVTETVVEDEEDDYDYEDDMPPLPAESPEDEYEFVRVEDTPEPETPAPPTPPEVPAVESVKQDDAKSQISEVTEATEATDLSSQTAATNAEDEAEREAKLAAKQEREQKRAAAAEKRRQEVERKRKEKEDQIRKEKEEQERQEQMKEELDAERKRREEANRVKKEEAERARQREKEEEELRQKRLLQQQERERKQQEEYRRKMEELQRKKREEEERKRLLALEKAREEEERRKEEEEMMAQMEESERIEYERRKREEEEERKIREEERRIREEEEAKIAMEQAKIQALIKAKQQAALEEKLKFARELCLEANGMEQTQNVHRAFTFSYFEILQMLGIDFTQIN